MLKRTLFTAATLLAASLSLADNIHLGIYMQGTRIGDAVYSDAKETVDGKEMNRTDAKTHISTAMLGSDMTVNIVSSTWLDGVTGRPVHMHYVTTSLGRTMTMDAIYGAKYVEVTLESGGPVQKKHLLIPTDGPIIDDPMPLVLKGKLNSSESFYTLNPDTISFVKDTVVNKGPSKVTVGGKSYDAVLIEVQDAQANMEMYVNGKGDLVEATGPFGMELIPDDLMADAPASAPKSTSAKPDMATESSIKPDKAIENPANLARFKFLLIEPSATVIPNDEHQTALKTANGWEMDVHPVDVTLTAGLTLKEAAREQPKWILPDTYIPSDNQRFKDLAKRIIGSDNRVREAAIDVQQWVAGRMHPNAGIGVLRDANEVLTSKEGVCRDYAILAATILRAGGVPTRLCSGLVSWDGTFYYHAWVEVWNGKSWIGVDPTVTDAQISAAHIKLADGDIATAFQFPVLDKVSIKVQEAISR